MFNPSRLTLARERRGMTKRELAIGVGLTPRTISAYENSENVPNEAIIGNIASFLGFPRSFFSEETLEVPSPKSANFRARSSMTRGQRDAVLSAGALAIAFSEWLETQFQLPASMLPELHGEAPETAAESVRALWGLGERPIKNVIHLLEAQGVRVFSLVEECHEVDAFSLWRDATPYVFLNTMKSAERSRFDAAHELGHLVLHRHGAPEGRVAEQEADAFAAAFLMPRGSVLASALRLPSVDLLVKAKHNWNVSVAALAHRLHALGLLSEWHYRGLVVEISRRGYRRCEPNSIPRETSQLLRKVFQLLREDGTSTHAIASELHLDARELNALIFGLILTPVPANPISQSSTPPRGRLSLV